MFPHHLEVEFFQLLSICFPNIISQDYISFFGDVQNRQLKSCFLWSFQSEGTDPRLQVRNHHGNSTASRLAVASSLLDLPYGSSFLVLELESKTTVRQNSGISRNINIYIYGTIMDESLVIFFHEREMFSMTHCQLIHGH